jgi:hypothetical protein
MFLISLKLTLTCSLRKIFFINRFSFTINIIFDPKPICFYIISIKNHNTTFIKIITRLINRAYPHFSYMPLTTVMSTNKTSFLDFFCIIRQLILSYTCKTTFTSLFSTINLNSFASCHIYYFFCHFTCMVSTAF